MLKPLPRLTFCFPQNFEQFRACLKLNVTLIIKCDTPVSLNLSGMLDQKQKISQVLHFTDDLPDIFCRMFSR